ncbi:MAG: hypothetical protein PGN07_00800 [Aeromicrobium erythreum]
MFLRHAGRTVACVVLAMLAVSTVVLALQQADRDGTPDRAVLVESRREPAPTPSATPSSRSTRGTDGRDDEPRTDREPAVRPVAPSTRPAPSPRAAEPGRTSGSTGRSSGSSGSGSTPSTPAPSPSPTTDPVGDLLAAILGG